MTFDVKLANALSTVTSDWVKYSVKVNFTV